MKDWYKKFDIHQLNHANAQWSTWVLFIFAFIDASFLPLPVATTFLLLILVDSTRSMRYIIFSTLGTLAGALTGYLIGHFAFLNAHGDTTGLLHFLFNHLPGFSDSAYNKMQVLYSRWDFWILFTASFIPIPYSLFSLSAGVFEINLFIFCIATLLSQALKFFLLAFVTIKLGPEVKMRFKSNQKLKPVVITASICIVIALLVTRII